MTERKSLESERAELVRVADDLDSFVHDLREEGNSDATAAWLEKRVTALRSLAAQDQKPVGYGYSAEIQSAPGELLHVCREKKALYDTPLYLSPPPAAGWDEAIEAAAKVADKHAASLDNDWNGEIGKADDLCDGLSDIADDIRALRNQPSGAGVADIDAQSIVESILLRRIYQNKIDGYTLETSKEIVSALSHQPAPVAANASAETDDLPAVRSANDWDKPHYNPGNASAEARETLTLDDALEKLHDLLVGGATGEDIKIYAAEHPQFSDQIFAFVEAWFSAGDSDE